MQSIRQFGCAVAADILVDSLTEHRLANLPLKEEYARRRNSNQADNSKYE
jgi:hypothetical protein